VLLAARSGETLQAVQAECVASAPPMPIEVFKRVVETTAFGIAHLLAQVLPVFRRQGHGTVIVVNSLLGSVTVPNMGLTPRANGPSGR
jgi:NAD(P)-dependent dehydrogenase (short-subunit alcohol dehydrogenase family)